jgi:hypothetical protein
MAEQIGPIEVKLTASGITDVINAFKDVGAASQNLDKKMAASSKVSYTEKQKQAADYFIAKMKYLQKEDQQYKAHLNKTIQMDKQAAREKEQITANYFMAQQRYFKQQSDMEISEANRSARARMAISNQLSTRIVNDMRRSFSMASRIAGSIFALGGGLSVANAFSREMSISSAAQHAALTTHVPGKPSEAVAAADLEKSARATAKLYNVHPEDVLNAQKELMSKSSLGKSVLGMINPITELGVAENTGQDPVEFQKELARSAGVLIKQGMKPELVMQMLRGMVGQGRAEGGTVEFSEMAKEIPKVTAQAGFFTGQQEGNAMKLLSMFQSATKVTGGDVREASTAVQRFTGDIIKRDKHGVSKVEKFLGHSVTQKDPLTGLTKFEDPFTLIPQIFAKSGGDIGKLENAGLAIRSNKLLTSYWNTYQGAESVKRGTGAAAVQNAMTGEVTAQLTSKEVKTDAIAALNTEAAKAEKVWNDFDEAIRTQLIPTITKDLIPALHDLLPYFKDMLKGISNLVSFIDKHPWEAGILGMGALITKAVIGQIMLAGFERLGSVILGAILGKIGLPAAVAMTSPGLIAGGEAAGGTATIGGALLGGAAVATGVGVAAIGVASAVKAGMAQSNAEDAGKSQAQADMDRAAKMRAGEVVPVENITDLLGSDDHMANANKIIAEYNKKSEFAKILGDIQATLPNMLGGESAQKDVEKLAAAQAYKITVEEQTVKNLKELNTSLAEAVTGIKASTDRAKTILAGEKVPTTDTGPRSTTGAGLSHK